MSWLLRARILMCGLLFLLAPSVKALGVQEYSKSIDVGAQPRRAFVAASTFTLPVQTKLIAFDPALFNFGFSPSRKSNLTDLVVPMQNIEPFGRRTVLAPPGALWTKWKTVEAGISAEAPAIARCRANAHRCTASVARFAGIVEEATRQSGRARLEIVNEEINAAIAYADDIAQAKGPHPWSAPLDADRKGAFTTGRGDCKDFAIAKYVALRESGLAAHDLRLLVVRDTSAEVYHAVVAARDGGKWLMLDNRWSHLIEEGDASFFTPLFALSDEGVKRFAGRETIDPVAPQEMTHRTLRNAAPFPMSDAPLLTSTLQNSSPA